MDNNDEIIKRLDVLIRLSIEDKKEPDKKFNLTELVQILNSAGLAPTDIAKLLGKKKASDIAPYLYAKQKKLKIDEEQQ